MAEKFVRSTRGVRDIEKLSTNLIEETDIVSTEDGKLFIKGKNEYIEIGGSGEVPTDPRVDQLVTDVEKIKEDVSKNATDITSITERISQVEGSITTLQTQAEDFENRIKALETPAE